MIILNINTYLSHAIRLTVVLRLYLYIFVLSITKTCAEHKTVISAQEIVRDSLFIFHGIT